MTVGVMLETITSSELTEWLAFAQLEPFGGLVEDLRAGLAPAVTANANQVEGAEPVRPLDFFPWHRVLQTSAIVPPPTAEAMSDQERARAAIFALRV